MVTANEVLDREKLNEKLGWAVAILVLIAAVPFLKNILADVITRIYEFFLTFGTAR